MIFIAAGVQRTGTNFCTQILDATNPGYEVIGTGSREYFWKHALPTESGANYSKNYITPIQAIENNKDLKVILVSKHPLWWLSSIINRDSADLVRQRKQIYVNGQIDVARATQFYFEFYRAWLERVDSSQIMHVTYHDLLRAYKLVLERINSYFSASFSGDVAPETLRVPYSKGSYSERKDLYSSCSYGLSNYDLHVYYASLTDSERQFLAKLGYTT